MRIAIVIDTVLTPLWSVDWKKLCAKNSLEFKEFDSHDPNFMDILIAYSPFRVLWRSGNSPLKKFKDEAQRQFLDRAGLRVVPNWRTHWVYDHKIRQSYLFKHNGIPQPETKIFFDRERALEHVKKREYPFVVKADGGAGSKSLRFVEDVETAEDIINNTFRHKGKWTGREYEGHVLYAQEYIPIDGVWRVAIIKERVAWGYRALLKPGTKKASGQGTATMMPVPEAPMNFALSIAKKLSWDWGMFDIIWSEKHGKHLVLEVCDTCGTAHEKRKLTYYRDKGGWTTKEENTSLQELIFRLFVLEEQWKMKRR